MEGGIDYLRKVIMEDSLGICKDLDNDMDQLVGTYFDEWAAVVKDPERRSKFRQFANVDTTEATIAKVAERGQARPQYWPKDQSGLIFRRGDIPSAEPDWNWRKICRMDALKPSQTAETASAAIMYGATQLAIFYTQRQGLFATQNMCPHKRAFVLSDGLLGDTPTGDLYVSCPLHKRNFALNGGKCLTDENYGIITFDAKEEDGFIFIRLPDADALDQVLATSKYTIGENCSGLADERSVSTSGTRHREPNAGNQASCASASLDW
jgi:nitrite reductase (NAD(P)H)